MSTITSIRRDKAADKSEQPDPLRQALAAAITAWAEAVAARGAELEAVERARAAAEEAEAVAERAAEQIATARDEDAEMAVVAIRRRAPAAPGGGATAKARAALEAAEDTLEISRVALQRMEAEQTQNETALAWSRNAVLTARTALIAPYAERVLEKARAARRVVAIAEAVLPALLQRSEDAPAFPRDAAVDMLRAQAARHAPIEAVYDAAAHFFAGATASAEQEVAHAAVAQIGAALEKLMIEAEAELPAVLP